jgi:hypothetical protein
LVAVVVYVLVRLSLLRLANYPYPLDLAAAWTGTATTAEDRSRARDRVEHPGRRDRRRERVVAARCDDLVASEAALGAVVVLWAMTDVVLLVLGPTGWYRPNVLRVVLALVVLTAFRLRRGAPVPAPRRRRPWPQGRGSRPSRWRSRSSRSS